MYLLSPEFRYEPLLLLPPRSCITIHPDCFRNITHNVDNYAYNRPDHYNQTDNHTYDGMENYAYNWIEIVNYICYVLLPMELFCSIVGLIFNIIILSCQIRLSLDTFLLGFSHSSLVYILSTIVMILPHYIGLFPVLVTIQFYNLLLFQWMSYTCIWILISVGIERALTTSMPQKSHAGTSKQTWIIISMVAFIGLISALPVLWEYRLIESNSLLPAADYRSNVTVSLVHRPITAENSGFQVVYFWYISSLFVYLPYFLTFVTCISLMASSNRVKVNFKSMYRTSTAVIFNRKVSEDLARSKLVGLILVGYVISCAPLMVLHFLSNPIIDVVNLDDGVMIAICNILTVWYYLYFVVQQQLYFCYNKQYRLTLLSLCCCGCR